MIRAEIKDRNGAPTIFVDGVPIDGIQYRPSLLDFSWREVPEDCWGRQKLERGGIPVHFDRTQAMTDHE